MATEPNATSVPPVEVVLSEVVTTLAFATHAYLSSPDGEAPAAVDLESAAIALDVAGAAFERIGPRLAPQERSGVARMLTDLRLAYVKKRGL